MNIAKDRQYGEVWESEDFGERLRKRHQDDDQRIREELKIVGKKHGVSVEIVSITDVGAAYEDTKYVRLPDNTYNWRVLDDSGCELGRGTVQGKYTATSAALQAIFHTFGSGWTSPITVVDKMFDDNTRYALICGEFEGVMGHIAGSGKKWEWRLVEYVDLGDCVRMKKLIVSGLSACLEDAKVDCENAYYKYRKKDTEDEQ